MALPSFLSIGYNLEESDDSFQFHLVNKNGAFLALFQY